MSVVGIALRGFGKALKKGKVSPTIKSVKPSVGKTKLQKDLSDIKKQGRKSVSKIKKDHMKIILILKNCALID